MSQPAVVVGGPVHLSVLGGLLLLGAVLIGAGRRGAQWPRAVLGAANLLAFGLNQMAYQTLEHGAALDNVLPLHLCDIAAFVAGFAVLTGRRGLCEVAYFWGLTGTLQALLTPNLFHGPQHPIFWGFMIQHGAVVLAALYFPLAMGWRASWGSFWRALFWAEVYFFGALGVNAWLGTNFGFLSRKPPGPTLLDGMGPWPWYLFGIQVLAILIFLLLLLPFLRWGGARGRKKVR